MNKNFYTLPLILLICWACEKQKREVITFPNGQPKIIWTYETDTLNGVKNFYWENGNPRASFHYRDGQLQGEFVEYYESGLIARRGEFLNGKVHGRHYAYSESDSGKILEEEYIMNAHGKHYYFYKKTFDSNGNIIDNLRFLIIGVDEVNKSAVFKYVDTTRYDSMKIIAGNFTEEFDLQGTDKPDTIDFVGDIAVLSLKKLSIDADDYLRGQFIGFKSRSHGDTVTVKTWVQYYEQQIKDLVKANEVTQIR